MIPILLDLLTIFFLASGAILLWLNLRTWRRTGLSIAPENYDRPEDHEKEPALPPREAESLMKWSTPFDDPIDLPDGGKLITLKDAATYITELPEDERQRQEWQKAARSLIGAAEHQDLFIQAHIDMLRAIPRNQARPQRQLQIGDDGRFDPVGKAEAG
jgi:hypothetical protein